MLGKLLFKSNCLQLLVTDVKSNYLLYFLQNLKSNMLQLQLLFTSKEITFVLHLLAAECDIHSNNDKIVQKSSNKSLQSASGSHMNWN